MGNDGARDLVPSGTSHI